MILKTIHIQNVRNISEVRIEFGNQLNLLYGENGSGKTTILESIYLLSSGKSFRSRQISNIIKENQDKLTLFGEIETQTSNIALGIEKSPLGHLIRINGELKSKVSELALCLPVLVVTQDSHKLLEAGPQWRREFIDWGLFHVKHEFHSIWFNYRKTLKNRNRALLNKASKLEIDAWNVGLASYGEKYSTLRYEYIEAIQPLFKEYAELLLSKTNYQLNYKQGWNKTTSLLDCLSSNYERDRITGRTSHGPHRGDITVIMGDRDVKDHASRGQQKLLVYALNLAQIAYLKTISQKDTLLLLDDLSSELDIAHTSKLLELVSNRFTQVCITSANIESLPKSKLQNARMFHVEHGNVVPM